MPTATRLFLIDGNSQMYRAYHAIHGLTGPDGKSTNAVFGFVTMLRKLIADQQPELIAAAFDLAGPTFRSELAANYKANRAPMPSDLAEQVPWVHDACTALGVPVLTYENYEADDVIGTLAKRAVSENFDVVIVTGDKDFFQLVDRSIRVFNPRDPGTWYDAKGVKEKFGVVPSQVVDVLALMGDAIDNVKGVPGIGEKGARALISEHGSLDTLLAHIDDLKQKKYRVALQTNAEAARQSRELVRLYTDVTVPFKPDELRYKGPTPDRCFTLFSKLGFRTLLPEYAPTGSAVEKDYALLKSMSELEQLVDAIRTGGRCGVEVLANTTQAMRAEIVGIALSTEPWHARYLPLGHRTPGTNTNIERSTALEIVGQMLADPEVRKVGHDLKTAATVLVRHGFALDGMDVDTMIVSYLLDATRSAHRFEDLALEHVGYKAIVKEDLLGRGSKAISFADLSAAAVVEFAGERSDLALQLADRLFPMLSEDGLKTLYHELELPLIPVLLAIECAGVRIDVEALSNQSARIEQELAKQQAAIYKLAGQEFNINSPKQLSEMLFNKLQLPTHKRTGKTRVASTSVEVLEELALVHELPRKVLKWRSLRKLKGTYLDALPQLVDPSTGRVHTSFNQTVTSTGRLSSSEPNLQNIPIRTEIGRKIRGSFIASPGNVLISADYSQIELRVLAHLSRDDTLIEAFKRGDDIHEQTAVKVFGTDSGMDPHELRRRAKIVNYALLYGKTAFSLAKDIGVIQQAAQAFIDAYFEGFPGVRTYLDETITRARQTGIVTTMFGRRRRVPELMSHNGQIRSAAERVTVNLPIQGTAADILKLAMIDIHRNLPADATMILTVHDELLFEVPEASATTVSDFVRARMEHVISLKVPLTVDIGIGKNWKEAKK